MSVDDPIEEAGQPAPSQPSDSAQPDDLTALNAIPRRYENLERADIQAIDRTLTPLQRAQFSIAVKAVERFIETPQGNLILLGAVGTGRTLLAAYIAQKLPTGSSLFLTLRQLIDWLVEPPAGLEASQVRETLVTIPVLIIDDFSAAYEELDEGAIQQLYDLVHRRWSDLLPLVLTSTVDLSTLGQSPVLEYLQQDAQVYQFDWKPIQLSRAAAPGTGHGSKPIPLEIHICPWLSSADDSGTPAIFPAPRNVCRRPILPQPVALSYQSHACLSGDYDTCPIFQLPSDQRLESLPEDLLRHERHRQSASGANRERLFTILGIVGIVTALLLWAFLLFSRPILAFITGNAAGSEETAAEMPTFVLPPTRTPTPTPTETPLPPTRTLVPTFTPTPPFAAVVTLAYGTNMRAAPDIDASVVAILPGGAELNVRGRDALGAWLRVATPDGREGWVAVSQLIDDGQDIMALPVINQGAAVPQPDTQTEALVSGDTGLTVTPDIPSSFSVFLTVTDISGCTSASFFLEHTFEIEGNDLTVIREGETASMVGSINPTTGTFRVTRTGDVATETFSGQVERSGQQLLVDGQVEVQFFGDYCNTLWTAEGSTGIIEGSGF